MATDSATAEDTVLDIGSRRELFVDHYMIDRMQGAALKLQEPKSAGEAIRLDRPWEGPQAFFYATVLKDGDVFRMYYRRSFMGSATCYAESSDGIRWTRPDLGLLELDGSKRNNAIVPGRPAYQFCPFVDTRPGVAAEERYKAVARDASGPNHGYEGEKGLIAFVSGDGIRWRRLREEPIVPSTLENNFDSQNVAFWSEVEGCYVAYMRHMVGGRRSTSRATSADFLNWSEQTLMSYSDTGTTVPSQHLYTNATMPYFRAPHIYTSMPGRMHFGRRLLSADEVRYYEDEFDHGAGGAGDVSEGVLLTTRAGSTRYDFSFRESFVRPGIGRDSWTTRCNYPSYGLIQTGPSEMSMFTNRGYGQSSPYLERLTLRLDGFASLHAPYDGGQMVTKPLTFEGRYLELNYSTSAAGSIRVEVQDQGGRAIPGYTLEECPYVVGNELSRHVGWDPRAVRHPLPESGAPMEAMRDDGAVAYKEGPVLREAPSDLGRLAGTPVRLRFVMKDADLFSVRFVNDTP